MNKTQTYSNALYAHLAEHAVKRRVNGKEVDVWSGQITKTCHKLGVPKGTERRVIAPLEQMDCIDVIQRGVAKYPSVVVLLKPPTEEMWEDYDIGLTLRPSYDMLSQRVEGIERQLGGANIGEALLNLDQRLTALESQNADKS